MKRDCPATVAMRKARQPNAKGDDDIGPEREMVGAPVLCASVLFLPPLASSTGLRFQGRPMFVGKTEEVTSYYTNNDN